MGRKTQDFRGVCKATLAFFIPVLYYNAFCFNGSFPNQGDPNVDHKMLKP